MSGEDHPGDAGPRVRCKTCNDVIRSEFRHDFKRCRCGLIFVDGGAEYLRLGFPHGGKEEWLEILYEESKDGSGRETMDRTSEQV